MSCLEKTHVLDISNDNPVVLNGLQDVSGEFRSDATVQANLYDSTDTLVTGVSWPLTMSYVSGSFGRYRGTIQSTAALTAGATYTLVITATISGDNQTEFRIPCVAQNRAA